MSERIGVQITATDGASRVFGQVASGADRMERSLTRADQAASRFSRSGAAIGAAMGATVGILSNAARAAAEAEVSQERLRASVEATGALYEQYADQLEAAGEAAVQMAFDDEDAADAISRLTQATGDAQTAINDLGLAMDIARGRGISLAEAANIVAAAEQGRFTALRRIGIQLDENATKEEAIAALQQKYAGQAAAYAETQQGAFDRMLVKLGNVNEALGEHTGSLQQVLMVLPGLSAGYTAIAAALGGLVPLLKGAGSAMSSLGMLGARGGILAGLGLVAYDLYDAEGTNTSRYREDWGELLAQAGQVDAALTRLAQDGQQNADIASQSAATIASALLSQIDRISELNYLIEQGGTDSEVAAWTAELTKLTQAVGDLDLGTGALDFMRDLNTVIGYTGAGAAAAQEELGRLTEKYQADHDLASYTKSVDELSQSLETYDEQAANSTETTERFTTQQLAAADAAIEQAQAMAQAAAEQEKYDKLIAAAQEQLQQQFAATTTEYRATTDALASGFRVLVQNTDAMAQQSQAVADWAENLIGAQGAYSKLDDLVKAKRITGESGQFEGASQYAAAQRAYNSILEDNAAIQEHILTIQAKQAPTIAALVGQQERYLEKLSNSSVEQQMLAVAYMDTATSAQALQLAQGYIQNQDVFGPMIQQAAALDPYLAMILEDMGIIERGADGSVTLAGAEDAKSQLDVLTDAINALVMTQWIAQFAGDITAAEAAYEQATGLLVDWDNSEGAATLTVEDYASATINSVAATLQALDGFTATTYVQTLQTGLTSVFGLGGIPSYATGGVTAQMNEWGTEMLHFPNGGVALTRGRGLYTVPQGTYVDTAPATAAKLGGGPSINVTISGNVYGIDDLEQKLAKSISGAWVQAMRMHERSYGAY